MTLLALGRWGAHVTVACPDDASAEAVAARFPAAVRRAVPHPGAIAVAVQVGAGGWAVAVAGRTAFEGPRELALAAAGQHAQLLLATRARPHIFIHAGVVAVAGRALLLPGPTGAGKTTLVLELLRRGARYLSDEYAVLDRHGRVHAWPRLPQVRGPTPPWPSSASPVRSLPVGLVALLARAPGPDGLQVRTLPAHEAALALLAHAVAVRSAPRRVLRAVAAAVARAPVWSGTRGEAATAADPLMRWMEAEAVQARK